MKIIIKEKTQDGDSKIIFETKDFVDYFITKYEGNDKEPVIDIQLLK